MAYVLCNCSSVCVCQRMGRTGRKRSGRAVMLVMEGKEEATVHKSSDRIAHVTDLYSTCLGDLTYCQDSPRILQEGVEPVMVLRNMQDRQDMAHAQDQQQSVSASSSTRIAQSRSINRTVNLTGDRNTTTSRPPFAGSIFQWSKSKINNNNNNNIDNGHSSSRNINIRNRNSKANLPPVPPPLNQKQHPPVAMRIASASTPFVDLSADSHSPPHACNNRPPSLAPNKKSQKSLISQIQSHRNAGVAAGKSNGKPHPGLVQPSKASVAARCHLCDRAMVRDENSSPSVNDNDYDRTCAECRHTMLLYNRSKDRRNMRLLGSLHGCQ